MPKNLNINSKYLTLGEDSPLMKEIQKPQLMHVKFTGRTTFFKQKQRNERIQDAWRKANPHKVSRPKAKEKQLNTEMTRDEFFKQERERAETKKKR